MIRTLALIAAAAALVCPAAAQAQSAAAYAVREIGPYDQRMRDGELGARLDPASDYARGLEALQAKHYRTAVRLLGRLTDTSPTFAGGWRALGAAYAGQERWAASRRAYKRALYLRPDEVVSRAGLAVALLALEDPKAQAQAEWLRARSAACDDTCPDAATFRALEKSGPFARTPGG